MKVILIESPFAGDVDENLAYVRACLRDSLKRGEAPFASHALYTQPGVLDDNDPDERRQGIAAGLAVGNRADLTAVYVDRGISPGMLEGINEAVRLNRPVEYRSIVPNIDADLRAMKLLKSVIL